MIAGINSFTCTANNSAGSSERSIAANVTTKEPVITSCTNKTAVEGTNLVWSCHATGSQPFTNYTWFKGNNVISSGNTLNKASIKRADGGKYRFTVSNGDECPTASTTVYLTVQYQPQITYPQSQACNPLTVNENKDATLVCRADGKPTPNITWTKDGVPLSKQGSPLVLQNVVRNQTGNYTCTADNEVVRADTACWKLDVKYFHNNERCGKTYEISSAQCLSVRLDGNPFPSVSCSPNDNVHVTRDVSTYNICGNKANTKTTCTVYNAVGRCDLTLEVHQHTMNKVWLGWYRITNLEWNDLLENTNSKEFSSLKAQNENMLKSVYAHQLFVTSTLVVNFRKGSVIVNYLLIITSDVSDPSLPFKEAINSSGGTMNGLSIDYRSIQAESYVIPTSSESPRTESYVTPTSSESPRTEQNGGGPNKRQDITEESGYMNAIVLQDRTNQSSSNQNTVLDYEIVDNQSQPGQSPANPPLYQSVQPHSGTYSSLSPATKLPPKPTLPSTQSQANTHTSVYQDLQGVSHQYQSLDSLSPC